MQSRLMFLGFVLNRCLMLTLSVLVTLAAVAARTQPAVGEEAAAILAIADVKVGMKGYGKTVFHGDTIEPFAFTVVSVVSDSSAKRGTVWVECTGERMQRSGPVQGMSGSPMYIWSPGEPEVLGEGGRLIGAFAFGYSEVNVCLVGVQPIEYMREVGARALEEDLDQSADRAVEPGAMQRSVAIMAAVADRLGVAGAARSRLDTVQWLIQQHLPKLGPPVSVPTWTSGAEADFSERSGQARPLSLPVSVGSDASARLLGPLLEPAGVALRAGGAAQVAGRPPSNVDPARVKLEPGSVLSIPLVFGDLDLNASGTVTEVLPDGTVLAFGHAMDAVGAARLPMATGYTHFVVSRDSTSFKLGSSLDIVGSVVRDEAAAVAGVPDPEGYASAPVSIAVTYPGQPTRNYDYRVVDAPQLTPALLGAVANASLTAVQAPPTLHTLRTTGTLTFAGDRTLEIDSVIPGEGINGLAFDLLPAVTAMMQNPFEPLPLVSADLSMEVENRLKLAQLIAARLDRTVLPPGGQLQVAVEVQPFDQPAVSRTLTFDLPTDLAQGEYQLIVSGAEAYTYRLFAARPDLVSIDDVDDLLEALQAIADVDREAIYLGLPLPQQGVAVAGRALSDLPSSRAAVLSATPSSQTLAYPRFAESRAEAEQVIEGEILLSFRVTTQAP
ncbi:MAG: hypothetical protein AAGG38_08765 [Planctomycetota bacterium]